MDFGIIFTVDRFNTKGERPNLSVFYASPRLMRKLTMTESDDAYDDYGCDMTAKHRKYAGILTKEEFKQFVDETGMCAEDVETMGAIGMPGSGYGCVPAISFDGRGTFPQGAIVNAYVTPYPSTEPPDTPEKQERAWRRIRAAILRQFS